MKNIFPAVLKSILKRKDTTVLLMFSLYPLMYLLSSLFGNSNFMRITVEPGHELSYISFLGLMLMSVDALILPTLALCNLVISVFKKEIENHTMFLYKDLDKKKIFYSKYISICMIVLLYFFLFALISLFVYYGRVIHLSIGANLFLDQTVEATLYSLSMLVGLIMKMFLSLSLATFTCLHLKTVQTMLISLVSAMLMFLFGGIGGTLGNFVPTGYSDYLEIGSLGIILSFIGPVMITMLYSISLNFFGCKKFKSLEF